MLIEEQIRYENTVNGGADVNVGFMDKVSVSVMRPRWYGKIYEVDKRSDLKVFNLFNLPIKVNGTSWVYTHLVVLAGLLIFAKIQLNKSNKKEKQWEESQNFGEHTSDSGFSSYSSYPM